MSRWHPRSQNIQLWQRFGDCLKQARLDHGLTQKELGGRVGLTGQAISSYERVVKRPDHKTIQQLIVALFGDEGWYLE